MDDINNAIALGVKPPAPPDVVGQITSLAQLQYLAAQGQNMQAQAALNQGKIGAINNTQSLIAGGMNPEDAVIKGGVNLWDPQGSTSTLANVKSGMDIKGTRNYAASPNDPNSAALMGPTAVGAAATANKTKLENAGTVALAADPTSPNAAALAGGPGGVASVASANKTNTENTTAKLQQRGQFGASIIAAAQKGPLTPEVRGDLIAKGKQLGIITTPQQEQYAWSAPDASLVQMATGWQAGGMTPSESSTASGNTAGNEARGKTLNTPLVTEPGSGVFFPPGLSGPPTLAPAPTGAPAPTALPPAAPAPAPAPAAPALPVARPAQPTAAGVGLRPTKMYADNSDGVPPAAPLPSLPSNEGLGMRPTKMLAPPAAGPQAWLPPLPPGKGGAPNAPVATPTPQPNAAAQGSPNYYGVVAKHESGMVPTAINPNGGAAGLYQFMPNTWATLRAQHPELGLTANGATDPAQATKAMQAFTADNAKVLSSAGVAVNDKNLFMAHFLGAGGAAKFIQAGAQNPNADAASLFPAEAKANPTIFYANGSQPRTLSQVYAVMTKNFGNGLTANGAPATGGLQMAQGAPMGQPGGSVPPNFVQPGQPVAPLAAATSIPTANAFTPPAAAQGAVAPIAPSPTDTPPAVPAPAAPAGANPTLAAPVQSTQPAPGVTAPRTGLAADQTAPLLPPGWTTVQPGMTLAQKSAAEATGRGMAELQTKQYGEAKESAGAANIAQMKLGELQESLDQMPKNGGLLTPGAGATERLGLAKYANTLMQSVGAGPIFDPNAVANAENSQKITGSLGFDMSKSLGSKEAASITQQAIKLNPGIENTPQGARVVGAAINAGLQRQKDFYQYLTDKGNAPGADLAFNKEHPPAQYIQEAQKLATVPPAAVKRLRANPGLSADFDQQYGAGLSRYYTGQ